MSSTRNKLIRILFENKDAYISGQFLSDELGVSRNTIWKHMNQFKKDGYEIESKVNSGYRIVSSPNKLSENTLKWGLETNWLGKTIIHRDSLTSTQIIAQKLALDGAENGTIVIADEQTAGKGRVNKQFHSLKNKGIYMSLILKPDILPYMAPQLTLLTATVLASVLDSTGIKPQIKWPNDVLIDGKKISGILTEMQAEQDKILYVVIGIGINLNLESSDLPDEIKERVTSLKMETGKTWDVVTFTQQFLKTFEEKYDQYIKEGFKNVKVDWENYGFKLNEKLYIKSGKQTFEAIFTGIAEDGALLATRENGEIEKVYSGEISWF